MPSLALVTVYRTDNHLSILSKAYLLVLENINKMLLISQTPAALIRILDFPGLLSRTLRPCPSHSLIYKMYVFQNFFQLSDNFQHCIYKLSLSLAMNVLQFSQLKSNSPIREIL